MADTSNDPVGTSSESSLQAESVNPHNATDRLLKISDRLAEASQELIALTGNRHRTDEVQTSFLLAIDRGRTDRDTDLINYAKRLYDERRKRDAVFNDPDLFGEPAWDILLDLMHAEHMGKRVSITSACIGSAVPSTTALRWIKILEGKGLIERFFDERDARRSFIRLSKTGLTKMKIYFRATRGS
ncbi:MAG TPA: MarR family transcriptional regulator [Novosphingobium sp.]|nr:MarR family transcriptional regulator [Novosphingobium sp.]